MKEKTVFVCQSCGNEYGKWMGRCTACGEWNTITEEIVKKTPSGGTKSLKENLPEKLSDIRIEEKDRISTDCNELNRVLGGGLVRGSMVLVGGEPGIGKSTLLLQICTALLKRDKVLYITGEESGVQIKMRADRIGMNASEMLLLAETDMENILSVIRKEKPNIVIVDSVQTMMHPDYSGAPGSVGQVRGVTMEFMRLAKEENISFFLVGHVTKEGAIAGPRILEHMVDCVLYFEGERERSYRILRAVKNRYGSTNEIGVFEMREKGLCEVENPSMSMLSGRPENASGSAVTCIMEGTRPLLTEIQALVVTTGFGVPRRMTSGMDYNRVNLIIAVLEKRLGLSMSNQDAYVNIAGGIRIDETAADLALACAVYSGHKNVAISPDTVILGEIGLTGEVRGISQAERRIKEIETLGFRRVILPYANSREIRETTLDVLAVKNIKEAVAALGNS